MMASSTDVSRLLRCLMIAVAKRMPLSFGILSVTVARRRGEVAFVVAGAVSGALIGALVGSGADEMVGLLVEHGDWIGHNLPSGMIELGAQVMPTARVVSVRFSGRV